MRVRGACLVGVSGIPFAFFCNIVLVLRNIVLSAFCFPLVSGGSSLLTPLFFPSSFLLLLSCDPSFLLLLCFSPVFPLLCFCGLFFYSWNTSSSRFFCFFCVDISIFTLFKRLFCFFHENLTFFLSAVLGFFLGKGALIPVSGRFARVSLGSPSLGGVNLLLFFLFWFVIIDFVRLLIIVAFVYVSWFLECYGSLG